MTLTVFRAESFGSRLFGLLARRRLSRGEALLLAPCASVHTCFMRYAIDVVFLNRRGRVLKVVERLPPWRWTGCRGAHATLELRAGQARLHGLGTKVKELRL
jgi:hypothetical protein